MCCWYGIRLCPQQDISTPYFSIFWIAFGNCYAHLSVLCHLNVLNFYFIMKQQQETY